MCLCDAHEAATRRWMFGEQTEPTQQQIAQEQEDAQDEYDRQYQPSLKEVTGYSWLNDDDTLNVSAMFQRHNALCRMDKPITAAEKRELLEIRAEIERVVD